MLAFIRISLVLLGFTGFYWVLPSLTGFYWVLLGFNGLKKKVLKVATEATLSLFGKMFFYFARPPTHLTDEPAVVS